MISLSLWVISRMVVPRSRSARKRDEQLLGFLRREHGRRLVEDQDARAAVQAPSGSPGAGARPPAGRRRSCPARRRGRCRASAPSSRARTWVRATGRYHDGSAPSITLSSADSVSTSMKCWCTMPMPSAIASREWVMRTGRPSTRYRAAVGLVEAVQDRHQRALAGTVLADDAMHGAGRDRQVDRSVGMHRAEALVDRPHGDGGRDDVHCWRRGQCLSPRTPRRRLCRPAGVAAPTGSGQAASGAGPVSTCWRPCSRRP